MPIRKFVQADIEGGKLRVKLQSAVGQVVMNPPRHRLPVHALIEAVHEPRYHYCRHRTHAATLAALIPDEAPAIGFIGSAVVVMRIAEAVDFGGPIGRTDGDA